MIGRRTLEGKRDGEARREQIGPGRGDLLGHRRTEFAFSSKSVTVPPTHQC